MATVLPAVLVRRRPAAARGRAPADAAPAGAGAPVADPGPARAREGQRVTPEATPAAGWGPSAEDPLGAGGRVKQRIL